MRRDLEDGASRPDAGERGVVSGLGIGAGEHAGEECVVDGHDAVPGLTTSDCPSCAGVMRPEPTSGGTGLSEQSPDELLTARDPALAVHRLQVPVHG